jgi:hypothetical protein
MASRQGNAKKPETWINLIESEFLEIDLSSFYRYATHRWRKARLDWRATVARKAVRIARQSEGLG